MACVQNDVSRAVVVPTVPTLALNHYSPNPTIEIAAMGTSKCVCGLRYNLFEECIAPRAEQPKPAELHQAFMFASRKRYNRHGKALDWSWLKINYSRPALLDVSLV